MGLDMYLSKKTYISRDTRGKLSITGLQSKLNTKNVNYIVEEAGYWRKANAIHNWFVENVQEGNDDCKEYYVSEEQLKELLNLVTTVLKASKLVKGKINNGYSYANGVKTYNTEIGKVIENPSVAQKLLPTASGFFFGSTDYNEYYIRDLKDTKKILTTALKDVKNAEYTYNSSW